MTDFISTDSELESFSEPSVESLSNEYSAEEAYTRSHLTATLPISSSSTTTTTTTTTLPQQSKDALVQSKLAQLYPAIPKSVSTKSKLNAQPPSVDTTKALPKQQYPQLYSSITEKPYEPSSSSLGEAIPKQQLNPLFSSISGKPYEAPVGDVSEFDQKLAKKLKEKLGFVETMPMQAKPELIPLPLSCHGDDEKKKKKDKKDKKDKKKKDKSDKRFKSNLEPHFMNRMATEMLFKDGIQNTAIQSVMKGELPQTLEMNCFAKNGPCQGATQLAHIREFHKEYYDLLYRLSLISIIETRTNLAIIIPVPRLLATLDPIAESTRAAILYHLVIVPRGQFFQSVEGMMQYETLAGDYVQVESDNGAHYINGVALLKPDINCTYHIYHVTKLLDRRNIVSIVSQSDDDEENMEEVQDDRGGEEEEGEDGEARGMNTVFMATKIGAIPTTLLKSNTSLGSLAGKMNAQFYDTFHEMKSHIVPSQTLSTATTTTAVGEGQPVSFHVNIYNTSNLFSEYSTNKMSDLSRLSPETVLNFNFSDGTTLARIDTGDLKMTQYMCNNAQQQDQVKLKKSDLERGLIGLSFQLENTPGFMIMMCKMSLKNGNCFASEDGNLLMRFQGETLDTISLNQEALAKNLDVIATKPLDEHHFFEYKLTPDLYKTHVTKTEFDQMLLMNGKVKRWIKRRTQQATDKAKCGYKRMQSLDLRTIPTAYLRKFIVEVNEKISSTVGQGSFVTLTAFDKSCHVLSSKSVLAKRFKISTEKEDNVVLYEFNSSESSASTMDGEYHMLEIQMDASPKLILQTQKIDRRGNFYFVAKRNANVHVFAFDQTNGRLRAIYIATEKSYLGKKILAYRV